MSFSAWTENEGEASTVWIIALRDAEYVDHSESLGRGTTVVSFLCKRRVAGGGRLGGG